MFSRAVSMPENRKYSAVSFFFKVFSLKRKAAQDSLPSNSGSFLEAGFNLFFYGIRTRDIRFSKEIIQSGKLPQGSYLLAFKAQGIINNLIGFMPFFIKDHSRLKQDTVGIQINPVQQRADMPMVPHAFF